jgi:RNA polymerase sigma-70 factor (ECF subfamily)
MAHTELEASLVERARQGDRAALEELIRRHSRPAARLAARLLGNREDAEDVVQEAFTKAFLNLESFRGRSAGRACTFRTWLMRITLNLAQDHLRRRHRLARGTDRTAELQDVSELAASGAGPRRSVEARDQVEHLNRALQELPARQKTALQLKIYEGLGYQEIAAVLGTSVGAARVYLALARQSLRRRYERAARRMEP